MNKSAAIVISTHRSGFNFLENLLNSFQGYSEYSIIIVINEFHRSDLPVVKVICDKFRELPITLMTLRTNSFEFGALYTAYRKTSYQELLLLSHSCEILDVGLFNILFEVNAGRSIAFAIGGTYRQYWQAHLGKYRRNILDQIQMLNYLPLNMNEAIHLSENKFTRKYHGLELNPLILFPEMADTEVFEEKFGKVRMKITSRYLLKYKSHWEMKQVNEVMQGNKKLHLGSMLGRKNICRSLNLWLELGVPRKLETKS